MTSLYDVLRDLIAHFGGGAKHDEALAAINRADPDHPASAQQPPANTPAKGPKGA